MEDGGLLTSFSQQHKLMAVALATVFVGSENVTRKVSVYVDENEALTTFSQAYKEYSRLVKSGTSSADRLVLSAKLTYFLGKAKFGSRHQNTFMLQQNLANAYLHAGDYALCAVNYESVIDYHEETQGEDSQAYYFALLDIINLLHSAYKDKQLVAQDLGIGQYARDRAIIKLISTTNELVSKMPENSLLFCEHTVKTAVMNKWLGKNTRLLNMAKQFSLNAKKQLGETSAVYVESLAYLGQVYVRQQKNKEAILVFEQVLANLSVHELDVERVAMLAHAHLTSLYAHKNRADKAIFHSQAIGKLRPWDGEKASLHRVLPKFPSANVANTDTSKASVILHFDLNAKGQPSNIQVANSTHAAFNRFAVAAFKQWYFAPKFVDGKYLEATGFDVTIDFIRE